MSEDMDLFLYGSTRVLRYFSLINHTAVLYYMKGILDELQMSQKEFKEICILSGTDYNIHANGKNNGVNLATAIKLFRLFKSNNSKHETETLEFYDWLLKNTSHITDIDLLTKINKMFDLSSEHCNLNIFKKIKIMNGPVMKNALQEILREDGFIFVK